MVAETLAERDRLDEALQWLHTGLSPVAIPLSHQLTHTFSGVYAIFSLPNRNG